MDTREYIRITEFCTKYGIEESLVLVLQEYEVVRLELVNNEQCLHEQELPHLEKMLRLHQELEINPEGLQAIDHLLKRINGLQKEVSSLRKVLNRFE
ncbi:chaperone modulator CbpM [Aurantibacter sp.]|uniref:chaperone modulator CbpM n=1 Tax=Aurantibacter sp. TaxID=2807103 RepID=UPI0032647A77